MNEQKKDDGLSPETWLIVGMLSLCFLIGVVTKKSTSDKSPSQLQEEREQTNLARAAYRLQSSGR
jgi:hypothetical protein